MASLTIGGQAYDLALTATDVVKAEERLLKHGGRPLLAAVASTNGGGTFFAGYELEALCWAAWRFKFSDDRVRGLLAQFYTEGGTLFELHREVVEALIDSGIFGRRGKADPEAAPVDPPVAGSPA